MRRLAPWHGNVRKRLVKSPKVCVRDSSLVHALLATLRDTVIPNLRRFPRMGRRYLDKSPQSAEAIAQVGLLPAGAADALRLPGSGDYRILYAEENKTSTVVLLSIRHHRQLSFDFARLWPGPPGGGER